MNVTNVDLDTVARTLYGECRGEPEEGQIAVAWVIRTRAEQPCWWGKTPAVVCLKKSQFSCWLPSDPNSAKLKSVTVYNPVFQRLFVLAKLVFSDTPPADPTNGATHYKVTGTKASWDHATEGLAAVVIGKHSFFKIGPH